MFRKRLTPQKSPPDPLPFQGGGEATPLISIQASEMSPSALHKTSAGISPFNFPFNFPFNSLFNSLFYSPFYSPFYSLFYFS